MIHPALLLLIGGCSFTTAVWLCRKASTSEVNSPHGGSSPDQDTVSEYFCGDEVDGNETATVVLGVFLNTGKETAAKPLRGVQYGVEVLRSHHVNFALLSSSLRIPWLRLEDAKLEPHSLSSLGAPQSLNVDPGTASLVYQKRTTCGYRTGGLIVKTAVRTYSSIVQDPQRLKGKCQYETSDKRVRATYDDAALRVILNQGSVGKVVSIEFTTGLAPLRARGNLVAPEGRDDDTLQLVQLITARLSSEILETGVYLNWASRFQQYMEYGRKEVTEAISVPPNKAANFFQASAICGDIAIRGWIIPVFLSLSALSSHNGECESPEFPEYCVTNNKEVGSPEGSLRWRSCHDAFREINNSEDGNSIQAVHGIQGPYAGRLGFKFEKKFLEILRELGDFTTTMDVPLTRFNWAGFNITNWTEYKEGNSTLKIPEPSDSDVTHTQVFQLVGQCELYTLLTQDIVFVQLNKENHCVHTIGIPSANCKVMQKWIDFK